MIDPDWNRLMMANPLLPFNPEIRRQRELWEAKQFIGRETKQQKLARNRFEVASRELEMERARERKHQKEAKAEAAA